VIIYAYPHLQGS